MRIGIIGSGAMAGALGEHWRRAGHEVLVAGRNPERAAALAPAPAPSTSAAWTARVTWRIWPRSVFACWCGESAWRTRCPPRSRGRRPVSSECRGRRGRAGRPAARALLDRQGQASVAETIVAGDESTVVETVRRYADAGATDLLVSLVGDDAEKARTLDLVAAL